MSKQPPRTTATTARHAGCSRSPPREPSCADSSPSNEPAASPRCSSATASWASPSCSGWLTASAGIRDRASPSSAGGCRGRSTTSGRPSSSWARSSPPARICCRPTSSASSPACKTAPPPSLRPPRATGSSARSASRSPRRSPASTTRRSPRARSPRFTGHAPTRAPKSSSRCGVLASPRPSSKTSRCSRCSRPRSRRACPRLRATIRWLRRGVRPRSARRARLRARGRLARAHAAHAGQDCPGAARVSVAVGSRRAHHGLRRRGQGQRHARGRAPARGPPTGRLLRHPVPARRPVPRRPTRRQPVHPARRPRGAHRPRRGRRHRRRHAPCAARARCGRVPAPRRRGRARTLAHGARPRDARSAGLRGRHGPAARAPGRGRHGRG